MSPEELFYAFPAPVPDLCWRLRDLVLEEAPGAVEAVRPRWRLLGFDLNRSLCAVAPQRDHARLVFEHGSELSDPDGHLQGSGAQARWLRFERDEDIDEAVVRTFLRQAIAKQR